MFGLGSLILALVAWLMMALPASMDDSGIGSTSPGGGAGSLPVVVQPGEPIATPPGGVVVSPPPDGSVSPTVPNYPWTEPGVPDVDGDRKLAPAPIEGLDLVIREIWPPQYVAQVTSGLPGGCSQFAGYTIERDGNTITIEVWNSEPAQPTPCTTIYGYHPFGVELGSDFESGDEYTVVVGERELTFIAQ